MAIRDKLNQIKPTKLSIRDKLNQLSTPTSYRPPVEQAPQRLGGAVEETSSASPSFMRNQETLARLQEQSSLRQRLERQQQESQAFEQAESKYAPSFYAPSQAVPQLKEQAVTAIQERDASKIRKEEAKLKADELTAQINQLKKEQGLFGTKNNAEIAKLNKERTALTLESTPQIAGFLEGASGSLQSSAAAKVSPRYEQAFKQAEQETGYGTGKLAGTITSQAVQYGTIGAALKGSAIGAKILGGAGASAGRQLLGQQATDLFIDAVIQTPREVIEGIRNDATLGEQAKNFLVNRGIDAIFNAVIASKDIAKLIKSMNVPEVQQAIRARGLDPVETLRILESGNQAEIKSIFDTLEPTTSKQAIQEIGNQRIVRAQDQFDKAIDDFQEWRRVNMGGATGKVSPEDMEVIKQLYKEDTGVNLDAVLNDLNDQIKRITSEISPKAIDESLRLGKVAGVYDSTKFDVPANKISEPLQAPKTIRQKLQEAAQPSVARQIDETAQPTTARQIVEPTEPLKADVGTSQAKFIETAQKSDLTSPELKSKLKELELTTTTNEARDTLAKQVVNEDFGSAVTMLKDGDRFSSEIEPFVGKQVVNELQNSGRYDEAVEIIEKMAAKFRSAGKDVQAASVWTLASPEGVQKWAVTTLKNNDVKVDNKLIKEIGASVKQINELSPEQLAEQLAKQIKNKPSQSLIDSIVGSNSFEQLKATNIALQMKRVSDLLPVASARKLSTLQAMAHLLNPRTFNRNIMSNIASLVGEQVSKVPATGADAFMSLFTGNRTMVAKLPKFKQALNEGIKQGNRSFQEIMLGVNKANQGKYDLFFDSAFKGNNPLSKAARGAEKALSLSLQVPDEFFKGIVKADSLYNQVRARIGKDVDNWDFAKILNNATDQEIKNASDDMLFATFQNDSGLAKLLSEGKKTLNRIPLTPDGKLGQVNEFGVGDLVLKYTRVPGNIITRGFEYSPLGYAKALGNLVASGGNISPVLQRQVAQQIGRATTGTGLIALGSYLYNKGVITGKDDSDDYDVSAFDRAEGMGNYKLNVTALQRLIKGEDPTARDGDVLQSYNWAQPLTIPIAVGAKIESKGGLKDTGASDILSATWEEAMDLPSLYTIKSMFYEAQSGDATPFDVLSVPVKEALPGFVPSAVRQVAQTIDPTIRQAETVPEKIQANLPFLSKNLPPRLDVLGREQTREEGVFANMINPASTTVIAKTEFGDTLRKISSLSGDTGVFPDRKPPNSFTLKNEKVVLTPEEKQAWQQSEGQEVARLFEALLKNKEVKTEKEAIELAKVLKAIKEKASEKAKIELLERRSQ